MKQNMFLHLNTLILLLCVIKSNQKQNYREPKFKPLRNAHRTATRLLELMRSYYEEANVRIGDLNDMRFMYEETPQYEQGYVMGEIIERYRKIVEQTKRSVKMKSDAVFPSLTRLELVQKLYFEIYHLVQMLHETPQKYRHFLEFAGVDNKPMDLEEIFAAQANIEAQQKRREKERKKRRKESEKMRQLYLKGLSQSAYGAKSKGYNKYWPTDYGWEIDYYW